MFLTIFTILLFQIQTEFNKFDLPFDIIGDQLNFYDDELNIVEQFSFENPEEIFDQIDKNDGEIILFDEFCEWAISKSLDLDDDESEDEQ